jgi:hypothetical protein
MVKPEVMLSYLNSRRHADLHTAYMRFESQPCPHEQLAIAPRGRGTHLQAVWTGPRWEVTAGFGLLKASGAVHHLSSIDL